MSEIASRIGNVVNPKRGVAALAVVLALAGCSSDSHKDTVARVNRDIAAAHSAGFVNARVRNDDTSTGPDDVYVQYGACWLEGTINGQGTVAIQDVNTNLRFNTGAVVANQDIRVDNILSNGVTNLELDRLTKAGLTGLNGCLVLAPKIEAILNS